MKNKEIQLARYFLPKSLSHIDITEEDERMFVEYTSQGKHKDKLKTSHFNDGFNALVYGKKYAGMTMGMWEEGVLEGSVPYYTLLGGESREEIPPRFIVDFMKKEMFKGIDAESIEETYQLILNRETDSN